MRQPEWMAILHPTLGIGFVDLLQVLTTAFGTSRKCRHCSSSTHTGHKLDRNPAAQQPLPH